MRIIKMKYKIMALQLRRKTHESIIYIDKDSAPRIMPIGEDFISKIFRSGRA